VVRELLSARRNVRRQRREATAAPLALAPGEPAFPEPAARTEGAGS
jgi:hypothetical protein